MKPLVYAWPGHEHLTEFLARQLPAEVGELSVRHFPDGESHVRLHSPPAGRKVIFACGLERPDQKCTPLYFAAKTARELGAASIGLVAPYLPYMRQDARFHEGEAVTSRLFAGLISGAFDWLATIDPHLHRHATLDEIYTIPTVVASAAGEIAKWIISQVREPLVIGPDAESVQWVGAVAKAADCPHIVLRKVRHGDRDVEIFVPDVAAFAGRTPVIVDDIISTAHTMSAAALQLRAAGMAAPVCIGVHALFCGDAMRSLHDAGITRIVTCNTVAHSTNAIDVWPLMVDAARTLLAREE